MRNTNRCSRDSVRKTPHRKGVALLIVLIVVMVITVLSLGFLSRSDVELAAGQNMVLKTQMDYLAESGLEHARGLILNPQDIAQEYWPGAKAQRLDADSDDYYDVAVFRDESDPKDHCNYIIDCNSYRLNTDDEKVIQSNLRAELRLDPCIALWTGNNTVIFSGMTINGDMRCNGNVSNLGFIGGDVFANTVTGSGTVDGQKYNVSQLSLTWPDVTVGDFQGRAARYESGNYIFSSDIEISGMLLVDGDLTIDDNVSVKIEAVKNLPALYVGGDLIIKKDAKLDVNGLAVVVGGVLINGDADLNVLGGLFMRGYLLETTADLSMNRSYGILHGNPQWGNYWGRNCLQFDGTDDYVQIKNESLFDISGRITVAAWIKVNSFDRNYQAIVTKGDNAWRIQRWSNTNYIEFACTGLSHSEPYGSLIGSIGVNDGLWHHIAGVYDGFRVYLYVDGNLDASEPSSGTIDIDPNDPDVLIGANEQQSERYWNGWIDDVQIYNTGLDVNDINVIRFGETVPGLLGRWRFEESGSDIDITAAPERTAILVGAVGNQKKWSQAAGAFYRSIERP